MEANEYILSELQAIREENAQHRESLARAVEVIIGTSGDVKALRGELLGDLQPGRIQRIETEQRYLRDNLGRHQSYIDRSTGWRGAAMSAAHYVLVAVTGFLSAHLGRGLHLQ